MKKNITIILAVILSLLLIIFLFFVNEMVITIRLNELKRYLQNIDKNEGSVDHIALIATYEINKKIYEERITQDAADSIEHKLNSMSLAVKNDPSLTYNMYSILSFPSVMIINLNRSILGKPPVRLEINNDDIFKDIAQAYYYEKNFLYKRAITEYDNVMHNNNLSSTMEASVLLRQGYCYALAGEDDKAMQNYNTIMNEYSYESSAITASILARYLEGFSHARDRILSDKSDPLLKSEKLVSLLAYEKALNIINSSEFKAGSKDLARLLYFKARCFSGLGQPDKAVEIYLKVITSTPDSLYAKFSNRKLFQIGSSAGGDNEILEISKSLNQKLDDPVLSQMIKEQNKTLPPEITVHTRAVLNVPESLKEKVEKMTEMTAPDKSVFLIIYTSDGNTFKGELIEKNDKFISIETSIGRIDVKKDKIKKVVEKQ